MDKFREAENNPFDAPVPGQSFTDKPGNYPWEHSPQYTDTGKGSIGGKEVNDFKSLSTTKMLPMLVKAIQELSTALDAALARIKKLEDG